MSVSLREAGPVPGAVVLLCGRSFSGKSTVALALRDALGAEVVGYDAINAERGLHGGQGVAVEEWIRTDGIAHERAERLLADGRTVVIDDTSSPRFLRDAWRALARRSDAGFALVFIDVDPAVIRRRLEANRADAARDDVLDSVLTEHLEGFAPPEADEPCLRIDDTSSIADLVEHVRVHLAS